MLRIDESGQFFAVFPNQEIPLPRNFTDGAFGRVMTKEVYSFKAQKVNQEFEVHGEKYPAGSYLVKDPTGFFFGLGHDDFHAKFESPEGF